MFNFIWLTTVEDERELINAAAIRKISPAKVFIDTAKKGGRITSFLAKR